MVRLSPLSPPAHPFSVYREFITLQMLLVEGHHLSEIVVCGADSINPYQSKSSNPTASHEISILAGAHFLV